MGAVQTVQRQPATELGSQEEFWAEGVEVHDTRGGGQQVVFVVKAVEQEGVGFVVDEQDGSVLGQFVHLEFVEPVQVLQVVPILDGEALGGLLDDDDAIGGEEDQEETVHHQQMPVLVGDRRPQLLQHRYLRPLLLQRVPFQELQLHSAGPEVQEGLVGLQLRLHLETLLEWHRQLVQLVHEQSSSIPVLGRDLPDGAGCCREAEEAE